MILLFLCLKLFDNWAESYIPVTNGIADTTTEGESINYELCNASGTD